MTDETQPAEAAPTPCLTTLIVSVNQEAGTAQVCFLHPDVSLDPPQLRRCVVPNPHYVEGEEEPEFLETDCLEIDGDPAPHVVKDVRVPLTEAGQIDQEAWTQRLIEQARGVRARMELATAPAAAPGALESLLAG